MGNLYFKANEEYMALAYGVMKRYHPELNKAKLQLGLIITLSNKEDTPALKDGVYGMIKVVPVKDRITKSFDVEMIVDGDVWKSQPALREPLLDHLLSRIEVKRQKPKKNTKETAEEDQFLYDEAGRPVIKMRKCDINTVSGFLEVINRHGDKSIEMLQLADAMAKIEVAKDEATKISEISS